MRLLTQTNNKLISLSFLLLRCTVGIILFVAGAGKVMGWFGGHGLEATVAFFVSKMHILAFLAYLSCFTEFLGGLLLILGLFTRPVAFAVTMNMLVATLMLAQHGSFMGRAAYPFTLMIGALAILLAGPMNYSLDTLMTKNKK